MSDNVKKFKFALPVSPCEMRLTQALAHTRDRPALDSFMMTLSNPFHWIFPLFILISVLFTLSWLDTLKSIVVIALAAGLSDAINTRRIKPACSRQRPYRDISNIKPIGFMNRGTRSFPSNHASNTMATAIGLGAAFPCLIPFLFAGVFLVGLSRVYCGAHYPLDVIGGWLHGAIWALLFIGLVQFS